MDLNFLTIFSININTTSSYLIVAMDLVIFWRKRIAGLLRLVAQNRNCLIDRLKVIKKISTT